MSTTKGPSGIEVLLGIGAHLIKRSCERRERRRQQERERFVAEVRAAMKPIIREHQCAGSRGPSLELHL